MGIQAGLVGLPNVGKSTLFNALTKSSVPAENYPFCTIDPHKAITFVPDLRLPRLQKLYSSEKQIPATVEFVDIAGLVKGAAAGEGLGNQFLSHIREVDLIIHVLRCFENDDIVHAGGTVNPLDDYEVIMTELALKDGESVSKRIERLPRDIRSTKDAREKKELEHELSILQPVLEKLNNGDTQAARALLVENNVKTIPLLSTKDFIVVANIAEAEIESYTNNPHYQAVLKRFGIERVIPVCVRTEYELTQLDEAQAEEMMALFGLQEPSLNTIIRKTYDRLGLITFFTCGPKEIHAWPIKKGLTVRQAAGEIHSDLERGFICAEVFNTTDLFELGSFNALKERGRMRTEGQAYVMQDGDIINVKFNV